MKLMENVREELIDPLPKGSLLVLFSYHQNNTEKIANVIAKVLDAPIRTPQQIKPEELREYDLIGFGSGIYDGKNHRSLLDLADKLPPVTNGKAFIFSTNGTPGNFGSSPEMVAKNHLLLREKLASRGYTMMDDFSCPGHNTNSFLKLFGGINKGRPNADDLEHAKVFAQKMKQNLQ